ncbi:telomerase protein component 1-like isoform X2 [Asterias amurensis]|uniref:telomerase protein component 1-like isoform X2 n=1 Tax=Asterias amurensis TaxID=7602 RepID=UPI003AB34357
MGTILGRTSRKKAEPCTLLAVVPASKEQEFPQIKSTETNPLVTNKMAERPKEKNNENEKETDSKEDAVKPDHGEEKISRVSHGAMMTPSDLPGGNDGVNGKKDPGKKVVSSSVKEPTDTKNAGNETEMVQPGKDKIAKIIWDKDGEDPEVISKGSCEEIERQCQAAQGSIVYPSTESTSSGWRVIRLFVSSTFHDFQNEREVLVKKVFPELREFCESRHLHLIECDLRWGVPKDSTTRTVLTTCLQEIDRCHGDADGQGFFLNMLGERYGWMPGQSDVPPDIAEEYQWVPYTSITHMEVLVGGYRSLNPNSVYFLRDPSGYLEKIPGEARQFFVEQTEIGKVQLKEMKVKLRERFPAQTFIYPCEFDSIDDESRVNLKGLDEFGQKVLEFFKRAIEIKYPESDVKAQTLEQLEQDQHDIYMEQKGKLVFGRDKEIGKMMSFAKGLPPQDSTDEVDKERHHMIVVADPGEGKSSLMARFVMEAKKAGLTVFYHFVGCTAESNRPSSILHRLVDKLEELYPDLCNTDGDETEDNRNSGPRLTSDEKKAQLLGDYIKRLGQTDKQLLLLVDAVNQSSKENDRYLWLPASLGGNIRCVMSTTREDQTLEELKEHCPEAAELPLTALDDRAREEIITNYFGRYNKTLDPEQLSLLTHSEGARNALWLSLTCEELRVFGVFQEVTTRIREMPGSLDGLIESILNRLISEDETGMVEKMLHFLECSRGGLKETELKVLLGDLDSATPAPALHWAMVRRTLKPFLRNSATHGDVERLQFFHLAINKAVQKHLTQDYDTKKLRHRQLANYYQYHCNDLTAITNQLARQLTLAKEGQRLVDYFRTDKRSTRVNALEKSRLLKEFRCTNMTQSSFPGCTKFAYCQFCANQRNQQVPIPMWSNKDCCAICGGQVQFPGPRNATAYWCMFHKPKYPSFGAKYNCFICQKDIRNPRGTPPLAYLCSWCDPGHMERCCKIVP